MVKKIPNPGSKEAVVLGCTCAVLDNCRGDPKFGVKHGFWITEGCPLHDNKKYLSVAFNLLK